MCKESFDVVGLKNEREAYEVQEYLRGLPYVEEADADFLTNVVVVEYDERKTSQDAILDEIENSGCKPSNRIDGILDRIKTKIAGVN